MTTQAYVFLLNWCHDDRQILESRCVMDNLLIPKLMVSIDERLHLCLKSCIKAEYQNKTCTQYLNFSSITFTLELNYFNYFIQPLIKQLKRIPSNDHGGSSQKKLNGCNNDRNKRFVNNDMVEELKLRAGESYDTVFKDKVNQASILLMDYKGCHKYHNKG